MTVDLVARSSVVIDAPVARVWDALVNPDSIRKYMFGADVRSAWIKGSPIVWKGEWKGKPYEDRGTILEIVPERRLRYSHFSPLAGKPDIPDNYHAVTIDLEPEGDSVRVTLIQDHNDSEDARAHSERNWNVMLEGMKSLLER